MSMFAWNFSIIGILYILFILVFLLALIIIIIQLIRGLSRWNRNNHAPCLTVEASVITKRLSVTHHHGDHFAHYRNTSRYYVTFQFDGGDRLELHVPGQEYGLLTEGDQGKLSFQGTRYISFDRYH